MLLVLNDLQYAGVRVISVADHLDTSDDNALLDIQVRGVFNELLLPDLRRRPTGGQLGQKERGYFVGEATFGYRSEAAGTISYDKHGRARPEGCVMRVDPAEAEFVPRIFREAAEDVNLTLSIVNPGSDIDENLRIRTPDGGEVPFSSVAVVEPGRGFASIRRIDRNRAVNVTAYG